MSAVGIIAAGLISMGLTAPSVHADGSVSGVVKFDGKMLAAKKIRVKGDAFCVKAHAEAPLLRETYLFNEDKGTLINAIVYVSGGLGDKEFKAPDTELEVDQQGCQYIPHVNAVMTGQKVKIKNTDDTAHNLNLKAEKNPSFNEGQPVKGMIKEVAFPNPELAIPLKCDVHSWMSAWIAVFDNPFHAVTDENGEFTISGLPAGTYQLSVWHEFDKFVPAEKTIEITVKDGETASGEFTFAPPGK